MAATGPRWLEDERVAQCVVDALRYGERQPDLYHLRAWVLTVNHLHICCSRILPILISDVSCDSGTAESFERRRERWALDPEKRRKLRNVGTPARGKARRALRTAAAVKTPDRSEVQ
jgi:hypothetical protein